MKTTSQEKHLYESYIRDSQEKKQKCFQVILMKKGSNASLKTSMHKCLELFPTTILSAMIK